MTIKPLAVVLALASAVIVPVAVAQRHRDDNARPAYAQAERGRVDRRCITGTTGAILGALAGGLLGRSSDGRGDRAPGTIVGAGGGALAGRVTQKSNNSGYCR